MNGYSFKDKWKIKKGVFIKKKKNFNPNWINLFTSDVLEMRRLQR